MSDRVFVCSLLVALLGSAIASSAQETAPTRDQKADFLRTAEIVDQRSEERNAPEREATLADGSLTHDAFIDSADVFERERTTSRGMVLNYKDTYKFNIAAYLLSDHLNLNMVPVTVERRVDGRTSAVAWAVDDLQMTEWERIAAKTRSPDPRGWASQMFLLRVFDQLIANTDRNGGNVVITDDWQIWMTDHSRAFRGRKELGTVEDLQWCDRTLLSGLRTLDKPELEGLLGDYLTGGEIDGVVARAEQIVELFDARIAELGEGAVLFDLQRR